MIRYLLLSLTLLSGCAGQTTYVDARFSPEQVEDIKAAARIWREAGEEQLLFEFGASVNEDDGDTRSVILSDSRTASWRLQQFISPTTVAITIRTPPGPPTVAFLMDRLPFNTCMFRETMAHEIGHMLGYPDIDDPRGVMYRNCPDAP